MGGMIFLSKYVLGKEKVDNIKKVKNIERVIQDGTKIEVLIQDYEKNKYQVNNDVLSLYPGEIKPSGLRL